MVECRFRSLKTGSNPGRNDFTTLAFYGHFYSLLLKWHRRILVTGDFNMKDIDWESYPGKVILHVIVKIIMNLNSLNVYVTFFCFNISQSLQGIRENQTPNILRSYHIK